MSCTSDVPTAGWLHRASAQDDDRGCQGGLIAICFIAVHASRSQRHAALRQSSLRIVCK